MSGGGQRRDTGANERPNRLGPVALALLALYVVVLALAAASELLELGWFDQPLFK